ncbi:hypothetical protein BATDEDRAFT_91223 [Batrachochytrium dendrobatidis JAM81]|uniref:Uncharacterized protein n=1 Tax=Batrachochytrium dendrobatidis (strain JAM81 / FGSC 10211) TaxID=684364 RepID=F4P9Q8_BATDJ|nr:uncharacterized protein BATDEDRAFT_91223 [Batrachochytrium dendrobatidis JAM81]EGF77963.1 hypothetical protein BATDEDRAFT_91223 [Batrachochytrium dendrobatidis JAM81]|eukprot:XP_006681530.1 hypothetical protein BATDEDRAFT_91223 [Batrachochytrium dendrobatidis JAM81]
MRYLLAILSVWSISIVIAQSDKKPEGSKPPSSEASKTDQPGKSDHESKKPTRPKTNSTKSAGGPSHKPSHAPLPNAAPMPPPLPPTQPPVNSVKQPSSSSSFSFRNR